MRYFKHLKISKLSLFFFALISTFAVPLAFARPESNPLSTGKLLVLGIVVTFFTSICMAPLINFKVTNETKSIILWFLFLAGVGIGRGVAIHEGADFLGFEDPATLQIRLLNSSVTTVFWVSLFSITVESSRVFRIKYHDAIVLAVMRLSGLEAAHSRDVTFLTTKAKSMHGAVSDLLSKEREGESSLESFRPLQVEVQRHINEVLRPLSHDIWRNAPLSAPRLRFYTSVKLAVAKLEYSYLAVLVPYSFLGFINGLSIFGAANSLLRLVIVGITWTILHRLFQITSRVRPVTNIIYLISTGLLPVYISEFLNHNLGNDYNYALATLAGFLMPLIIIAVSAFDLINRDREEVLKFLNLLSDEDLEDLKSYQEKRLELAGFIHNSLQSELLAMAMQLAHAQSTRNHSLAKSTAERLQALLIRISNSGFQEINQDPHARAEEICQGWLGICDVRIKLEHLNSLEKPKQVQVVQLCEEFVTNAVRIGNSTQIDINGTKVTQNYEISFLSNGILNSPPSTGFGESWISSLTDGKWRLFESPEGVVGHANISLGVDRPY